MNNSHDNRAGLRSMLAVLCLSLLLAVPAGAQGWKDWTWWPISGGTQPDVITSPFGIRNKPGYDCHRGLDLSAYYRWVYASYDGRVVWTTVSQTGGNMMAVSYLREGMGWLCCRYLHLDTSTVIRGADVSRRDQIAISGCTGSCLDPHLHFETTFSTLPNFPDYAIRYHPAQALPGITDAAPLIARVDTVWLSQDILDYIELLIEEPQQDFNMTDIEMRTWDPLDASYSYVKWNFQEFRIEEYYRPLWQTILHNIDTDSLVYAFDYQLSTDVMITAEEYDHYQTDPFRLHIKIWPRSSHLQVGHFGVRVSSYSGRASTWGNFSTGPRSFVEWFSATLDGSAVFLDGAITNCNRLRCVRIMRSDKTSLDKTEVCQFDLRDSAFDCQFRFADSTANPASSYTYTVLVQDELGLEYTAGTCSYEGLPSSFSFTQNYPNPFNLSTTIEFSVPGEETVDVTLSVFNVLGQRVSTLHSGLTLPGRYVKRWDGMSESGESVASGVYLYRLESADFVNTKKMVLLK